MKSSKCSAAPKAAKPSPVYPRLLRKRDILEISGVSYQTIWQWMRDGKFPRSRVTAGKSSSTVWRSDEVQAWIDNLPVRKLKGDTEVAA
jgi:predicted DNA-binding transcriptional regulator AlpA